MPGLELPLRIIDQPGGPVIRCLCGVESAVVRAGPPAGAAPVIRAAHGARVMARAVGPGTTPADVLRMVLHARRCVAGRNRQREATPPLPETSPVP